MTRWPDTMDLEDPRSNGNGNVIAQVVLEQIGVPAGGQAAAVGVVAVGQAHGLAVAGDVPGMAFNAQAGTIAAQIVAAEAFGPSAGDTGVSVAGRTPALRSAGGRPRAGPTSTNRRVACRAGTRPDRPPRPSRDGGRPGASGGRGPSGPAGKG